MSDVGKRAFEVDREGRRCSGLRQIVGEMSSRSYYFYADTNGRRSSPPDRLVVEGDPRFAAMLAEHEAEEKLLKARVPCACCGGKGYTLPEKESKL